MNIYKVINRPEAKSIPQEEIRNLVQLAKKGCLISKEKLMMSHTRLIYNESRKYYHYCNKSIFTLDDLFAEGIISIEKAIEKFDVDNEGGASFTTYVKLWASALIRKLINEQDSCIVACIQTRKKYKDAGIFSVSSLDKTIDEDGSQSLCDIIEQNTFRCVEKNILERESQYYYKNCLENIFRNCSPEVVMVIKYKYGLINNQEKMTADQVAKKLNLPISTVNSHITCFFNRSKKSIKVKFN